MQAGQHGYGYGPQGPAGVQGGYGPQGGYGVPPQMPYAPPVQASAIAGMAMPTMALLGARAALPALARLLGLFDISLFSLAVYDGLKALLGLAAIVCYFIWFARLYGWVRANRGGTSYSTGLAIGGWFIPFANIALPYLALNDAARRTQGSGNPLVLMWWLAYLGSIFVDVFFRVAEATNGGILPHGNSANSIYMLASWFSTFSQVGAYGLWALLVKQITDKAR